MSNTDHWNEVYIKKAEAELSWRQDNPSVALDLMKMAALTVRSSVIDIGEGTSRLMDRLLDLGLSDLSALDMSESALAAARVRLGVRENSVKWIVADITRWEPTQTYDIWHDCAVFHFLVKPDDRDAYIQRLSRSVIPGGHAIIAAFALDGPEKCSGPSVACSRPNIHALA
ncbi:class I SAM-dependent methyltransferase [Yoonia sp.]|jgi:trans-aconitate methyltransferase|uniref:class I SAM-dependent methyltransferase n=1 Tax=Yoonia sp. TaxID=2212373 RepID=UPI0040474CA7